MEPLSIDGAWGFAPRIFRDSRGSFLEWYRSAELDKILGYQPEIAQANCSVSRRGVIRGIHFADLPPGQAKYVTCVSGAITDIVVDIRVGSPSYGHGEAVRLDDTERNAVFLAEGLGHAFLALTDDAVVMYLCSTPYAPGREKNASAPTLPLLPGRWQGTHLDAGLRRLMTWWQGTTGGGDQ
jgi:dTDP-4-dehydrorhamnose 3,5-epimerase